MTTEPPTHDSQRANRPPPTPSHPAESSPVAGSATLCLELPSLAETEALGRLLASCVQPGDVLALIGPLGAGKTQLVKAFAAAAGTPTQVVNSPTFTLIHEYDGPLPVRHCDAYRLRSPDEFPELGLEDLFADDGVALIEWADRVSDFLPNERLEIRLEPTGLSSRRATLVGLGPRGEQAIQAIAQARRPT